MSGPSSQIGRARWGRVGVRTSFHVLLHGWIPREILSIWSAHTWGKNEILPPTMRRKKKMFSCLGRQMWSGPSENFGHLEGGGGGGLVSRDAAGRPPCVCRSFACPRTHISAHAKAVVEDTSTSTLTFGARVAGRGGGRARFTPTTSTSASRSRTLPSEPPLRAPARAFAAPAGRAAAALTAPFVRFVATAADSKSSSLVSGLRQCITPLGPGGQSAAAVGPRGCSCRARGPSYSPPGLRFEEGVGHPPQ